MRVVADFVHFANPIMLKLLIDFVSDRHAPIAYGVAIAIGMFAFSEVRSLLFNHFFTVMITTSVQVQTVLTNAVYAKALRLSAAARNNRTVGAIVNLMAIDIEKICQVMPITQHYWSSPLQLTIAMCLLWWTIGPSAIAGIAVMLLMVPVNYFSSVRIKNWQVEQMKVKDERTKICNEVLNGIKLIKLYAWEEAFEEKINALREQEVQFLRRIGLLGRIVDAGNAAAPFVVAVASFSLFVLSDDAHVLTPQIAFVCLTIFNQIRQPMRIVAMLINMTVQAIVSNKRLKEFMSAEERVGIDYETPVANNALEMRNASWAWKSGQTDLKTLSFSASTGSLTAIVGAVGAGKSSLLSAIIGEMELQQGSIALNGRIAYVPQQAWLLNATVRENVLFGREYQEHLYNQITTACELLADFAILPDGDATPVGENGVSLSGGQKARICLARALYQECDIYLLDDPLSAVDAHVGEAIYEQVLGREGLLRHRTRLLVTHGLQYTKQAENVLVLREGAIIQQGSYDELEQAPGVFKDLLTEKARDEAQPATSSSSDESSDGKGDKETTLTSSRRSESSRRSGREKQAKLPSLPDKNLEAVEVGKVKLDVWCSLIRAATYRYCIPFIAFYVAHFGFQVARNLWLSNWSDASANKTSVSHDDDIGKRLGVYTALGLMEVTAICGAFHFLVLACQQASLNLHGPMLRAILRSPMHFFDTTPIGRILNRLSRELDVIDVMIPINVRQLVNNMLQVVAIVIVISYSTPLFIAAIIPLTALYVFLLKLYMPTARQLRRLESTARSPILSIFAESIHGVTSIRAYDKIDSSCRSFEVHVDKFAKTRYFLMVVNRFLGIYLELFGNFVVLFAALFAVISSRFLSASPGLIGLSVSYALTITEMMNMAIRMMSEMETNAVSVERVQEYTKSDGEAPWKSPLPPPEEWPVSPTIDCHELSLRYRTGLPLVLRVVDARIRAGEKVAIVGRTGSGKSSLTLALFRMVEPAEGSVVIDGIDTSRIGLHELRRKLAIIPQEPVLFSGSLRFNLDPFEQCTDEQLWRTLELCQLKDFVSSCPEQLSYPIAEGGKNISVGQKQLLCLARVLLRRAKVLVLDEATASVDILTDSLVQTVVREQFAGATVIAIAHRLNTVAGYDRIMVLEKGRIVEFDTPSRLLADRNSRYSRMLEKSKRAENRRK
uniref:ABC-type glutathione-S-conjugate transporter n=1 Tax=Pristionchus pacificus TaxID=54126 RepID=A0A2A6BWX6_PRIPA|eukprot:PDM70502.1 ABC transporter ATP-binding protein [Pristionchus pacificus]